MAKLLLGIMCMVFALLCGMPPASALEWEHEDDLNVWVILPSLPNGGWVDLYARCRWEQNRCMEPRAWLNTAAYTYREFPVTVVIDRKATHAVVQFLDGSGSIVTVHAIPGQQQTIDLQQTTRGHRVELGEPLRFIYTTTWNNGYATGTLLGQAFDTREIPDFDYFGVQLMAHFSRWLDPPAPTLQPAVK